MNDLYAFHDTLRKRAHWTNEIINKGVFLRLGIMEETITDMHLLTIADEHSGFVLTKKFTRREEGSISGADWLWVIGEPRSWIPLLVQAKIVNPKTGNCQYLDYKDGEQRRRLLSYARQHRLIPVYCIYSYIPSSFRPPEILNYKGRQKEDWACSFVSPKAVRLLTARGLKHQEDILKFGIPWMDPFNPSPEDYKLMGQTVAENIINLRNNIDKGSKKKLTTLDNKNNSVSKRSNWENLDTHQGIKQEIPKFICNMFKDFYNPAKIPLTGVSILSTVPINQISELKT